MGLGLKGYFSSSCSWANAELRGRQEVICVRRFDDRKTLGVLLRGKHEAPGLKTIQRTLNRSCPWLSLGCGQGCNPSGLEWVGSFASICGWGWQRQQVWPPQGSRRPAAADLMKPVLTSSETAVGAVWARGWMCFPVFLLHIFLEARWVPSTEQASSTLACLGVMAASRRRDWISQSCHYSWILLFLSLFLIYW